MPIVEKIINRHCASSVSIGNYVDPACSLLLNRTINHLSTGKSRIKIITCPSKNGIPFSNTLHRDNHDKFTAEMNTVAYDLIANYLKDPFASTYTKQLSRYLVSVHGHFGSFCSGTRVTYHFVENKTHNNNEYKIIQYFILYDLGICVQVNHLSTHYFYGGYFLHCSSIPIIIHEGKVYVQQDFVDISAIGLAGILDKGLNVNNPLRSQLIGYLGEKQLKLECKKRGINEDTTDEEMTSLLQNHCSK